MTDWAIDLETASVDAEGSTRNSRRRRRAVATTTRGRQRLRLAYFALASMWGFTIGTAAVLGGLAANGQPLRLDPLLGVLLLGAVLVAVVGGAVTATAYRGKCDRW